MHGNDQRDPAEHHLYKINDRERKGVYKFGISSQALNQDGSSPRANEQVNLFNKVVGWARFFTTILLTGIQGRAQAQDLEEQHAKEYEEKYGHQPPGNI